ncbi:NF2L2-like protein [Mya arenaria]|uniref:NF2L2-like protein n=1 Tax=Mya arenaria TaxID=6604 RepID=A0ABY7EDI1_MYAAR|nr:NF2L2-like protein [Mya arenaria]
MLKQYFTDGLIQIAIVLSLLRTDLNNYLNVNYVNYPEVQEILQGQTAAYTQTSFHLLQDAHLGSPEIYRKDIDANNIFGTSFYRDIRSFRPNPHQLNEINIPTFLLVSENANFVAHEAEPQNDEHDDENNNSLPPESQTQTIDELQEEGVNLLSVLEENINSLTPLLQTLQGTDPTREDLDLIEVLWRQDIDLGIGKEVFDPNLRRELERDREIELQKDRQKQKDEDLLQKKLEEQRHNEQQQWLHDNFTQDGETGEWVPLSGSRVAPPSSQAELTVLPQEQFVSSFDTIPPMMGDGMAQEPQRNYSVMPSHPPPSYATQQQGMYNGTMAPPAYNQSMGSGPHSGPVGRFPQQSVAPQRPCPQVMQPYTGAQPSVHPAYNATGSYSNHQHNYTHPQNNRSMVGQDEMANMTMPGHPHSGVMPVNTSSMLIQNASMPTPAPMNGNITFNNSGRVSGCHRSPPHSSGMLSPCSSEGFNSSMPGSGCMAPLEIDTPGDSFFPNISSVLSSDNPGGLDNVDDYLPDLMEDEELEDINFSEMGLDDGAMTPKPSGSRGDVDSSDSAVSMGSAGSPDQNDFSDGAISPFDGLEGATGGHDSSSTFPKTSKYDPDDYKYGNSCSYSSGGDSNCSSNFSSASNDTGRGGHFGQSNGHSGYHQSNNGHINHNHSYPLKPGQEPKDYSKKGLMKEGKHKGPQSKDNKRVAELSIPYTVDEIVNTPVEEFNEMMTRHKFNDQQLQLIRDIRRRGKNKVAAQNCRKRKIGVLEHLEDEMTTLEKMRDKLQRERQFMDKQTREMKEKLGLMYSEIFHSLRDEHGNPYDPSRFSLQQSSDGDVFLVPRNYTSEEDPNKRKRSEQK